MMQNRPRPVHCTGGHGLTYCDCSDCPGMEAQQKVEAFKYLVALLQDCLPYLKVCSRNDINGYSENTPHLYEEVGALIAKATSPQAQ